jgi:hypothetical protein
MSNPLGISILCGCECGADHSVFKAATRRRFLNKSPDGFGVLRSARRNHPLGLLIQ